MRLRSKLGILLAALVLGATPTLALAAHPNNGKSNGPGPNAKAYGKFCQGESKKHVKGEKGTPFSQCVQAMAKLASGKATNPTSACKGLSKNHIKGQKGTPYSVCVSGAAKLQRTM
jgi:hypothetical protein